MALLKWLAISHNKRLLKQITFLLRFDISFLGLNMVTVTSAFEAQIALLAFFAQFMVEKLKVWWSWDVDGKKKQSKIS